MNLAEFGFVPDTGGDSQEADLSPFGFVPEKPNTTTIKKPAGKRKRPDASRAGTGGAGSVMDALSPLVDNSFMQNLADSATFGFRDEAQGAIGALLDKLGGLEGGGYETYRDASRDDLKQLSEESPNAAIAGQIAGLVGPGAVANLGLKAAGKGAANLGVKEAAAIGVGEGATMGAGASEADDVGELMADIAIGGATGAAGGTVGAKVGQGINKIGKGMANEAQGSIEKSVFNKITKRATDKVDTKSGKKLAKREKKLEALMRTAVAKRKMRDRADLQGRLEEAAKRKAELAKFRAEDIADARRKIKKLKAKLKEGGSPLKMEQAAEMLNQAEEEVRTMTTGKLAKETLGKMYGGVKETLSDVKNMDFKKLGPQMATGVATGAAFGPLAGAATALGAGTLKHLDMSDAKNIYNTVKRGSGENLMKLGQIGPTKVAAATMGGVKTDGERTKEWLKQQQSQTARKRMRSR